MQLIPNVVRYEHLIAPAGDHIEVSEEKRLFLKRRGHQLKESSALAITQLIVQSLKSGTNMNGEMNEDDGKLQILRGSLTGVSDPRKGGLPAAV